MNCFTKTITLQRVDYKEVVFRGDRRVLSNFFNLGLKGEEMFEKRVCLSTLVETNKERSKLSNIPIVREFSDVFPDKLTRLPLEREIEVIP
jgi:hypothetical protein